ncbi:unnamed protein product [Prorocentrum cordatum]|uniref:Uncharacterized protein n=1 Tax=Prorocentrum cordatum TaxID=2364126 RepID=A0ABN9VVF6_9DINO|nr:unnamed protein product [Polarella glacialis]
MTEPGTVTTLAKIGPALAAGIARARLLVSTPPARWPSKKSFQSQVHDEIHRVRFNTPLKDFIQPRLNEHCILNARRVRWDTILPTLRRISAYQRMVVLKSWMRGWHTSHRMHERHRRGCLFNCGFLLAEDSWDHYIICPRLHHLVFEVTRTEGRANGALYILGLGAPPRTSLLHLVISYETYHAIKFKEPPVDDDHYNQHVREAAHAAAGAHSRR